MAIKIIFLLLVIVSLMITGCTKEKIDCEKLVENKCLEHQDVCGLCPKTVVSSYAGCHSKEFCKNVQME